MKYDPVKRTVGRYFHAKPWRRKLFFRLLDLLLLRSWHIRKEIREWYRQAELPARVLDAGAGFGQYSYFLARLSGKIRVCAVDIAEDHVRDCSSFFIATGMDKQVECLHADLTSLVEPNTYHLVLSVDVMEHIEEDSLVFRNFFLSLKQGGMLLLSTPSDKGGSGVRHEDDQSFIDEHVRDGYGIKEIENKLKSAGFSRVMSRYSYGRFGHLSWLISMKYPILMISYSNFFLLLLAPYYLLTYPICLILNYLDLFFQQKSGTGLIVRAWK